MVTFIAPFHMETILFQVTFNNRFDLTVYVFGRGGESQQIIQFTELCQYPL